MPQRRRRSEEGALLIILMVGVAVTMVGLAVAFQTWSTVWRRDNEEELIFRGQQYVLALRAYQKERGTLPLNLDELMKPGPRQVRYIRKLFKDPMKKDAKWGLLYLVPGGKQIYDPVAAQKAKKSQDASGWGTPRADEAVGGLGGGGFTAIQDTQGTGVPNPGLGGQLPGQGGQLPGQGGQNPGGGKLARSLSVAAIAAPPPMPSGDADEKSVSEAPIGWPIAGVISRVFDAEAGGATATPSPEGNAEGAPAKTMTATTFKTYRGHEHIDEWQFHVYDNQNELAQTPQLGTPGGSPAPFLGPGFGGQGPIGGMGGGARPGGGRQQGGAMQNWMQGTGGNKSNPRQ